MNKKNRNTRLSNPASLTPISQPAEMTPAKQNTTMTNPLNYNPYQGLGRQFSSLMRPSQSPFASSMQPSQAPSLSDSYSRMGLGSIGGLGGRMGELEIA